MGAQCSCDNNPQGEEVKISRMIKHLPVVNTFRDVYADNQDTDVLIELAPLSEINPRLARNLSLQALSKGFLSRLEVKDRIHELHFKTALQLLIRKYLAKVQINSLKKSLLFGRYKFVEGIIFDMISKDVKIIKKTFRSSEKFSEISQHPLVLIKKDEYYQGEWQNEKKSGFGILKTNLFTYVGNFKKDQKSGFGLQIAENGDIYKGEFKSDNMNGVGELKTIDERLLKGEFIDGYLEGEGEENWSNGVNYHGIYAKSKKEGLGVLNSPNFSVYTGSFSDDLFHGRGQLVFEDGKRYDGDWKKGKMHGKGEFKWPNGKVYIGEYKNDMKNGMGRIRYPDGKIYNGEWKEDLQHGKALFTFFDKAKGRNRTLNSFWQNGARVKWLKKNGTSARDDAPDIEN